MTNRLVVHLPGSCYNFDSDDLDKLTTLSSFCKKELNAYHASENIDELTVDTLSPEKSDKFHSLILELNFD